ncbi:dihydropteroate synthase [Namhaeicola litoreus]|uniref:Dihydropteroate synthase n=1 Tax=Namhaeicola litoreus TaxID=1052145 RepID=A0ABW3Y5M6_9FLAO
MSTINCKGKLIDLSQPRVMGILNLTPDSFYDGGKYSSEKSILEKVETMLLEGATFIDIGGYSSRPGAKHIEEEEELKRVLSGINLVLKHFPETIISIDTFRGSVAKKAIEAGAALVNDISAGNLDEKMFKTVAELQVPYIMMHMPGSPQTMQKFTHYEDIIQDIILYFSKKIVELRELQLNDLIIDVGFGFGKTLEQNYLLLKKLSVFKILEVPILAGLSRKSMLYKTVAINQEEALNATSIANTLALTNGANILRVHDVKEAVECIKIFEKYNA